jgi:quercetin dioxygenase-like cupin family protein
MSHDPVVSNKDLYRVVMENDRVRVLAYADRPGDRTTPHRHPDSVMVTLSGFRRRLSADGREMEVELAAGEVRWLDAQEHSGENIGDTECRTIFVELKEPKPAGPAAVDRDAPLGPTRS